MNTTYKNPWDTAKVVVWGKFVAIKTPERSWINNLALYLKELEKQEQIISKGDRRKAIKHLNTYMIYKLEIQYINEMKSWFFQKVNKVNKPLGRLRKKSAFKYIDVEMKCRYKYKEFLEIIMNINMASNSIT